MGDSVLIVCGNSAHFLSPSLPLFPFRWLWDPPPPWIVVCGLNDTVLFGLLSEWLVQWSHRWQVLPCLSVESGVMVRWGGLYRGRGEQRGPWDNLGYIRGRWLVEAVIHHPGCAQAWIHGIRTIFTPWAKLVRLKTVPGKSFSFDLLGWWGNHFRNCTYKRGH